MTNIHALKDFTESQKQWLQFKKHHIRQLRTKAVLLELKQLGFHGLSYFSPLKACFTFEIESLDMVTHLSPILFRDGVLGLADFFYKNPFPQEKTQILIHKNLTYLIPKAWKDHCFAYEYQSRQNKELKKTPVLIIGSSGFGHKQGAQRSLDLLIKTVKQSDITFDEVWLSNFPTFPKESLRKDIELQNEHIDLAVKATRFFDTRVLVKTPYQIEKERVNNSYYWDLNYYQFYYSDSFFYQSLMANGSCEFALDLRRLTGEIISEINLSFFHKIIIYRIDDKNIGNIEEEILALNNTSLLNQAKINGEEKDTLPPKPIEEIIFKLAQEFYTP